MSLRNATETHLPFLHPGIVANRAVVRVLRVVGGFLRFKRGVGEVVLVVDRAERLHVFGIGMEDKYDGICTKISQDRHWPHDKDIISWHI